MEYTITAAQALLHVHAWGRETTKFPLPACTAILDELMRLGLKRVLVELRQKVALSGVAQFEMVDRMRALGITPDHRIALVHYTPGLYEASDMLELAAGNRGLNVKNFRDREAALAWLE
ncbi:MAG TPA: hypothetical protein VLV90_06530 [Burkholderiales bacterium]|nr:hypothetical protein [Burkholderiales bacterium]